MAKKRLRRQEMYRKAALHEIGHLMGLGDNVAVVGTRLTGKNASTVMNLASALTDDPDGNVAMTVTPCDTEKAKQAYTRRP
jgi:ABC-type phosphate/phosphonate transport system ATPase subunit